MNQENSDFIQTNSPDGGFLQSDQWRKFQEVYGRKTFHVERDNLWANVIEHSLPIVGRYFYVPRGPIISRNPQPATRNAVKELIALAKENNSQWIRIEPATEEIFENIKKSTKYKLLKAPHDMQPKELFIINITKPDDQLLAEMKPKTRYNIRLAEKKNISVISEQRTVNSKNFDEFLRLVRITSERQKISSHPKEYYRKMWETLPPDMLKLYIAEYEGKVIAANLVLFFGKFATYLHGASDNQYRETMAPYLLQWQAIKDAKARRCEKYDLGGIAMDRWSGITKFKLGFSSNTSPTVFLGSYDIIINPFRYYFYRFLQKIKSLA